MNRVVLVNTFLNFKSLQFSISIKQLLLGLPPQRILLQRKYPTPSVQVLSSTSKTGLCRFLRISTAEWEIEHQLRLQFFDAPSLPCKTTKFRKLTLLIDKRHFCQLRTCWTSLYLHARRTRLVQVDDSFFSFNTVSFPYEGISVRGKSPTCWSVVLTTLSFWQH